MHAVGHANLDRLPHKPGFVATLTEPGVEFVATRLHH